MTSALAAHVGFDQAALDGCRRQSLVPECNRQFGQFREIAGEGARRLRARTFRAVHIDRQAEHEADRAALGRQRQQPFRVSREIFARHGLDAGRQPPVRIADRDADGFGTEIEPDQAAAGGQMFGGFHQWHDKSHVRSVSTR